MAAKPERTSKRTNPAGLLIGLMIVLAALVALLPGVSAVDEYDCRDQQVCDPSADGEDAGCAFSAEWGTLTARAHRVPGAYNVALYASADSIGGNNFDRWIITLCDSVDFRPYASATAKAFTDHCWKDGGHSYPYPCASVSATFLTNTAGSGSGQSFGAFCGWNKCEGLKTGTADHLVTDISLNQPGNKRIDVWGDAAARYWEDDEGNGCVLCPESRRGEETDTDLEIFWIGSTPPL